MEMDTGETGASFSLLLSSAHYKNGDIGEGQFLKLIIANNTHPQFSEKLSSLQVISFQPIGLHLLSEPRKSITLA
jgi:hypothetical protein